MQKERMIKLIEDLASAGYEIVKIDNFHNPDPNYTYGYGDTEILLYFDPAVTKPFSKERMTKLIEVLFSNDYGILEYKLPFDNNYGNFRKIELILQSV
jgi:hypothetical protein